MKAKKRALPCQVAAIILAGGEGSRLWPLTQHRCKSGVCFGGKYRLIDIPISSALNSSINCLFVIPQNFIPHLHRHIASTYASQLFNDGYLVLLKPREGNDGNKVQFEGTADAIRKNIDQLMHCPVDYFLILPGDQLYNMNLMDLVEFAICKKADMVISSLYVDELEIRRMGVLEIDDKAFIRNFCEKPSEPAVLHHFAVSRNQTTRYLASMGIYVFRRDTLFELLQKEGNDFGYHLIPQQVSLGGSYAYIYDGYWVDIGTIASFYEANMALLKRKSCLNAFDESYLVCEQPYPMPNPLLNGKLEASVIGQGSIVEGEEIQRSIIGFNCHVKKGTKIFDSIVMGNRLPLGGRPSEFDPFSIGENCIIRKAIIDEHVRIGSNVRLINERKLDWYDGDQVCIRNGIIIVKAGANIGDGFTL